MFLRGETDLAWIPSYFSSNQQPFPPSPEDCCFREARYLCDSSILICGHIFSNRMPLRNRNLRSCTIATSDWLCFKFCVASSHRGHRRLFIAFILKSVIKKSLFSVKSDYFSFSFFNNNRLLLADGADFCRLV